MSIAKQGSVAHTKANAKVPRAVAIASNRGIRHTPDASIVDVFWRVEILKFSRANGVLLRLDQTALLVTEACVSKGFSPTENHNIGDTTQPLSGRLASSARHHS